jgi:dsRNA-specific ribonuclease
MDLPYNPGNKLLAKEFLDEYTRQYSASVTPGCLAIYQTALVHKSYCTRKNDNFQNGNTRCPADCIPLQEESNERLEFVGDAIISLIIGKYLFLRYPNESEGFLTKIRTKLVNGNMLSDLCRFTIIPNYVLISKQIEETHGRYNKKILEDAFEAFIAAMFLDLEKQGKPAFDITYEWFINFLEDNVDFTELLLQNNNHKDMFLKWFQHQYNYLPKFQELDNDTTTNGKNHRVVIKDKDDVVIAIGSGCNKKQAENDAAMNALTFYGVNGS